MSSFSSYSSSSSSSSSFFNFFAKFESKGPRIYFAKRKPSLNRFYWSIIIIVNIKGKCRDDITVSLKTKILFVKSIIMYISFSVYSFFSSFVVPLLCFFFFSPVKFPYLHFLDAFSHLYKRVCPSVGPSIGTLVGLSETWICGRPKKSENEQKWD